MIRSIQYLRGIAAMMVVWHHALTQVDGTMAFIRLPLVGRYGVDLFFMISGFIMLVTTWDKPIGPAEFVKHRIRRIVPLYWLATLLMVGIAIAAPNLFKSLKWDAVALVKSLLFIPYQSLSFPAKIWPLLVPGWSLNYEIFFYALFALTLLLKREWRMPAMVGTISVLIGIGIALHISEVSPLRVYTDPKMLEFAAGMVLGRLWVMKKRPRRDGGHPILMALGDASYSIYLSHLFTLGILRVLWVRLVPTTSMASSIALMAVSLILSAVVGWLCYRLVERSLTEWFSKRRLVIRIEVLAEKALRLRSLLSFQRIRREEEVKASDASESAARGTAPRRKAFRA